MVRRRWWTAHSSNTCALSCITNQRPSTSSSHSRSGRIIPRSILALVWPHRKLFTASLLPLFPSIFEDHPATTPSMPYLVHAKRSTRFFNASFSKLRKPWSTSQIRSVVMSFTRWTNSYTLSMAQLMHACSHVLDGYTYSSKYLGRVMFLLGLSSWVAGDEAPLSLLLLTFCVWCILKKNIYTTTLLLFFFFRLKIWFSFPSCTVSLFFLEKIKITIL